MKVPVRPTPALSADNVDTQTGERKTEYQVSFGVISEAVIYN